MSQKGPITVTVTNGDATVTTTGGDFLTSVAAGQWFTVVGSGVSYQIASITDNNNFELTGNYAGTTNASASAVIQTSWTTNRNLPKLERGDIETATIFGRFAEIMDTYLGASYSSGALLFGNSSGGIGTDDTSLHWDDTNNVLRLAGGGTAAALSSGQANLYGKTTTGAVISGYGSTYDVTLQNRSGTNVLGIGPNSTAATFAGVVTAGGAAWGWTVPAISARNSGGNASTIALAGISGVGRFIAGNAYYASGWKYAQTDYANLIDLSGGDFAVLTSASGSTDGAITWLPRFTMSQAGTLTIQGSAGAFNEALVISGSTTAGRYVTLSNTGANLRIGIDNSAGNALISGGTAYGAVVGTSNATDLHLVTNGASAIKIDSAGLSTFAAQANFKSFTVGTVPSAATAGGFIYVSNETGGAVPAFSDGTNWRRVTDRAVIA